MAERLQASEQPNIHERGGLTPEHWQEIVRDGGLLKAEVSGFSSNLNEEDIKLAVKRIIQVGKAMIEGHIDDPEPYLGKRHWDLFRFLDEHKEPRRFHLPSKKLPTPNLLLQQAKKYAREHDHLTQSVNDTIACMNKNLSEYEYKNRKYKWTGKKWVGDFGQVGYLPKYGRYTYPVRLSDTQVSEGIENEFGGGINDVLHTSLKVLGQKLIELSRTNPEKYGRVEKPIPQVD